MFYLLYNVLTIILLPIYLVIYGYRFAVGKDNIQSIKGRFALTKETRPEGKLIWLHAASVGESMVALTIIEALEKKHNNLNFLITTGTISSAKIIAKWKTKNCHHQFTPNDNLISMGIFLRKWNPDLALFIESELWPCMLKETANNCPVLLINARLSDRSYARWQKFNGIFASITDNLSGVLAQSKLDMQKYKDLGAQNVKNFGNLKFSNKELAVNEKDLKAIAKITNNKPVFVAASTHREDEEITVAIIRKLLNEKIRFFSTIVLRHPERRKEVIGLCEYYKLKYSLRSEQSLPNQDDDVYIVDTFGELGTFYSLSDIAFVGGSFKRGGHNLLEPAYFNCAIFVGPDMSNFQNITDDMVSHNAAIQMQNNKDIEEQLRIFLAKGGAQQRQNLANNALKYVKDRQEVLAGYIEAIEKYI